MISLGVFSFLLSFSFLGLLEVGGRGGGGKRSKKLPKMKNDNYICHMAYFRKSIAYDYDFWYTCVKWWYLPGNFFSFFFFEIFIFQAVKGVKGEKMARDNKKILSGALHISRTIYDMIVIYDTLVSNVDISRRFFFFFFIFSKFWFSGSLGREGCKRAKDGPKWEKILCRAPYHRNHTHMIFIYGTHD